MIHVRIGNSYLASGVVIDMWLRTVDMLSTDVQAVEIAWVVEPWIQAKLVTNFHLILSIEDQRIADAL